MRSSTFKTVVLLSFLSCNYFSKNQTGKLITIRHVSVSKLPMICEHDKSFYDLTDSLLFKSKLWPEAIKIIQDSIKYYYLTQSIVSNSCLIDEVIFPGDLLEKFNKPQDIDSLKIIVSRDFENMIFDSYGFFCPNNDISLKPNGFWEIENQLVEVKEDAVTKKLFLVTMDRQRISFDGVIPMRNYVADIRYKEKLVVYFSNNKIDSIITCSPKAENIAHLARLAENLQEAKSL
jgi:hypothetical protein